jgi:hypothetical protein
VVDHPSGFLFLFFWGAQDEAFSMPQIIHFAETLAKYLHGSFAGRRSTWNTAGPNVDYDVITVGVLSPNTLVCVCISFLRQMILVLVIIGLDY